MATIKINLVEFDPYSTYYPDTLDLGRVKEIEADLQGYVFDVDADADHSIDDQVDAKLYNMTGLEVRQVVYTEL